MRKSFAIIAALSGFMSVALGAFAAHGLKHIVSPKMIDIFNLGVQYQFYHTFALLAVAVLTVWFRTRLLAWAGYCFIVGMIFFSGSLYLYALLGTKWTGPITPIGGFCFLAGWGLLAAAIWRDQPHDAKAS